MSLVVGEVVVEDFAAAGIHLAEIEQKSGKVLDQSQQGYQEQPRLVLLQYLQLGADGDERGDAKLGKRGDTATLADVLAVQQVAEREGERDADGIIEDDVEARHPRVVGIPVAREGEQSQIYIGTC